MITTAPAVWSKANSELLARFLESGTGSTFLEQLASARPTLLTDCNDVNSVALRSQYVAGFERAFQSILSLAVPPVEAPKATDAWPDLDRPREPGEAANP